MDILMSKQPSYVRCIKPNHDKKPGRCPPVAVSALHLLLTADFRFFLSGLMFYAWSTFIQVIITSRILVPIPFYVNLYSF